MQSASRASSIKVDMVASDVPSFVWLQSSDLSLWNAPKLMTHRYQAIPATLSIGSFLQVTDVKPPQPQTFGWHILSALSPTIIIPYGPIRVSDQSRKLSTPLSYILTWYVFPALLRFAPPNPLSPSAAQEITYSCKSCKQSEYFINS